MTPPQSLARRRIVDLSQFIAGSVCGQLLADFGAQVVKVEPPAGDPARSLRGTDHGSIYFRSYNTSKSSLVVDLETEDGRDQLEELLGVADALVVNFGPRTLRRLGLDWDHLHQRHPHLVMAAVSGYGLDDERTAFDSTAQAESGYAYTNADVDGTPRIGSGYLTDVAAGLYAAFTTAMMLVDPTRSTGTLVDVAMLEVAMSTLVGAELLSGADGGMVQPGAGSRDRATAPSNIYPCRDGYVYAYAGLDKHWDRLRSDVGGPAADALERLDRADEFDAYMAAWTQGRSVEDVCTHLGELGVPVAPALHPVDALGRATERLAGIIARDRDGGAVPQFPVLIGGERPPRRGAPPLDGASAADPWMLEGSAAT